MFTAPGDRYAVPVFCDEMSFVFLFGACQAARNGPKPARIECLAQHRVRNEAGDFATAGDPFSDRFLDRFFDRFSRHDE